MELMEKLKKCIKEIEESIQTYEPDERTLEAIQTNMVNGLEMLVYQNYRTYSQQDGWFNLQYQFNEMTKISHGQVIEMRREVKEDIRRRILQRLQSIPMKELEIKRCYQRTVEPIQHRLEFLTQGKNVENINWLTKEQMFDIYQKLIQLVMMRFDELLGLETNNKFKQMKLVLELALLEKKTNHTDSYILASEIHRMTDIESECEELKEMIKSWYKKTKQTFIEDLIKETKGTHLIKDFSEWNYLLTPEQKKQLKGRCVAKINQEFQKYESKKGEKKVQLKNLDKLKRLERELEEILAWLR